MPKVTTSEAIQWLLTNSKDKSSLVLAMIEEPVDKRQTAVEIGLDVIKDVHNRILADNDDFMGLTMVAVFRDKVTKKDKRATIMIGDHLFTGAATLFWYEENHLSMNMMAEQVRQKLEASGEIIPDEELRNAILNLTKEKPHG